MGATYAPYVAFPGPAVDGHAIWRAGLQVGPVLDVRAKVRARSWSAPAPHYIAHQFGVSPHSWRLLATAAGEVHAEVYDAAGASLAAFSLAPLAPAGTWTHVRFTYDGTTGRLAFYESAEGSTWIELGATTGTTTAGSLGGTANRLAVGGWGDDGSDPFDGDVAWVEVRTQVDGPIVERFDAADIDPGSYAFASAATGETWTIVSPGDTNDPVFLPHGGRHYVWTPADNGNFLQSSVSGLTDEAFDIRADFYIDALPEWGSQRLWEARTIFEVVSGGRMQVVFQTAGGQFPSLNSGVDGEVRQGRNRKRVTLDPATGDYGFFTRDSGDITDDAGWSLVSLGTDAGMVAGMETAAAAGRLLRHPDSPQSMGGSLYAFEHRGHADISLDLDRDVDTSADPDAGQASIVAADGRTWSVIRGGSGHKTAVVTRPVWVFDGADDYLQLPASDAPSFSATTGKHSFVLAMRQDVAPITAGVYWSTRSASSDAPGIELRADSGGGGRFQVVVGRTGGGAVVATDPDPVPLLSLVAVAVVVDDGTVRLFVDGVEKASVDISGLGGDIVFAAPRLGATAWAVLTLQTFAALLARFVPGVALSAAELAAIGEHVREGSLS